MGDISWQKISKENSFSSFEHANRKEIGNHDFLIQRKSPQCVYTGRLP